MVPVLRGRSACSRGEDRLRPSSDTLINHHYCSRHTSDLRGVVAALRVERKEKEVKLNTMETRQPEESYLSARQWEDSVLCVRAMWDENKPEEPKSCFFSARTHLQALVRTVISLVDHFTVVAIECVWPRFSFLETRYNCGVLSTTHPSVWHADKLHRATRAAVQRFRAVIHVDESKLCQVHLLCFFSPLHPLFPYFSVSSWDIKYVWIILYLQSRTLPTKIQSLGDHQSCF